MNEHPHVRIGREKFLDVVKIACAVKHFPDSSIKKWLDVARSTTAVAVGWFHCDGFECPARQARRQNQAFQFAFDELMWQEFEELRGTIFVAEIFDGPEEKRS